MSLLDSVDSPQPGGSPPTRVWSSNQEAIFSAVEGSEDNLLIQAVAGSGKTTTLVEATRRAQGTTLFLAFNKAIAEELKTRVTYGDVKTMNALGHRLWLDNSSAKFDMNKLRVLIDKICPPPIAKDYGYTIGRVVGLVKSQAGGLAVDQGPVDSSYCARVIENYQFDVPCDQVLEIAQYCATTFELSIRDSTTFDFDDQLYGPLYHQWDYPSYTNVMVDEAQDLSPIQHAMLQAMRGSRIIAVGDRHQAIYGFRGASHDSMDELKEMFLCKELPLDITYRCPVLVTQEAQKINPDISWREGASPGEVNEILDEDPELWTSRQLVLARTNAPLFRAILRHIRKREPCRVLSNFLDSFQSFVRGLTKGPRGSAELRQTSQVIDRLNKWYDKEREAAQGRRGRLAYLHDRYETVKLLLEQHSTVYDACETVKRLADCRTGPLFSTIHKAKGLESSDVYIIRPDLMPHPMADGPKEMVQEMNLKYVAITRSSDKLTFGQREF